MGLVNETIQVRVVAANYKHYENKGYILPRKENNRIDFGSLITIKTSDLMPKSGVKVEIECDNCHKRYLKTYQQYTRDNHNGKIYCNKCAHSLFASGENHYLWRNDLTSEEREIKRNYSEYTEFVMAVLARDNYTCQCCGKKSGINMKVHHLYGYACYPEYRVDQTQALTLCENCHTSFHFWHCQKYGYKNKGKCTRKQYEEWLGKAINDLKKYEGELPTARQVYDYTEQKIYKSANEWAELHNYDSTTVYNCCNRKTRQQKTKLKNGEISYTTTRTPTIKGHLVLWYDEYTRMSKYELQKYLDNCKSKSKIPVVCLNNERTFESIADASRKSSVSSILITKCCKGELQFTESCKNQIKFRWMYLSDFEKLSKEEQEKLLNKKDGENK